MSEPLIIRADADSRIGTGHLMRCIALGQAWRDDGGKVMFSTCCDSPALLQLLHDENFEVIEIKRSDEGCLFSDLRPPSFAKAAVDKPTSDRWMVLDGYHFTVEDHRAIRNAGGRLLVIDDCNHLPEYECDILLNQNVTAESLDYCINPEAQRLLGPQFVLLRREFQNLDAGSSPRSRGGERGEDTASANKHLLVTMGGADPDNASLKVISALQQLNQPELQVKVVVGPANPHTASLEAAIRQSAVPIRLIHSAAMADLMQWADVCISAAGSTCWELLSMGVPFATVILADNQEAVARYLEEKGAVRCFGRPAANFEREVADVLETLHDDAVHTRPPHALVDGRGAHRVVAEMKRKHSE